MDTDPVRVAPENGDSFTLDEMQSAVGGRIEVVPVTEEGLVETHPRAIVNEEGFLKGMELNGFASVACGRPIAGTVLLILEGQIK